ncbi:MAG: ATP-binding protein [Armatimonadetes bacterium]|nr:ATP-binding protein [Armatimonadota bacterium]
MPSSFWRWVEQTLRSDISKHKVRLIFGARQTGKSTLLQRLAPADAIFINLQSRRERLRFERGEEELLRMLRAERKSRTVLIDEIQKAPALLDDIQLLYDENPEKFEFFLTGSSARKLRTSAANLLPGRAHQYHLFPLILAEREGFGPSETLPVPDERPSLQGFPTSDIESMLICGNLPGISLEADLTRKATLESYAEIYVEEEIRREALVRNIGAFSRFLELAALESGQVMNLSGLSQQSGIPIATLRAFYQVLVDTFIGFWLQPFAGRTRRRLLTTPMFYFFDQGVRNALAGIPLTKESLRLQAGTLFQQWAVTELWRRCGYLGRGYRLHFWRSVSGAEVDMVLETPEEAIPIEVKWTENPRGTDARHLISFLKTYPAQARRGYIVCRCPHRLQISDQVTAIPWQKM